METIEHISQSTNSSDLQGSSFVVHQIWYQGLVHLPERYHVMRATWCNEGTYKLWDSESIAALFEQYPLWKNAYHSLTTIVEKVDFAKYLILYHEGGLYADMDIYKCVHTDVLKDLYEINDFVGFEHNASRWTYIHHKFFGMKGSALVNNAVIIAKKGNCILAEILNESMRRIRKFKWIHSKHLRIVLTTGPLMYTNVIHGKKVLLFKGAASFEPFNPSEIRVLYSRGLQPEEIALRTSGTQDIFGVHFMDLTWLTKGVTDPRQRFWVFLSRFKRLPIDKRA